VPHLISPWPDLIKNPFHQGFLTEMVTINLRDSLLSAFLIFIVQQTIRSFCRISRPKGEGIISRSDVEKYQFLPKDTIEMVLSLAEMLEPGKLISRQLSTCNSFILIIDSIIA